MTIYVDELFVAARVKDAAKRYGRKWCHMWTDAEIEELHLFAEKVFAPVPVRTVRSWFQPHATLPHYDLTPPKRQRAVLLGAVEMTQQERLQQEREKVAAKNVPKLE